MSISCIVVNGNHIEYDDKLSGKRQIMVADEKWQDRARGLLKAELARRNVGYKELVGKLAEIGIKDTPQNIANKLSRGGFSAAYLLQCLHAIGCRDIRIGWDEEEE
jgi:3-mercaptopyruvate sulfurtransferase SseA